MTFWLIYISRDQKCEKSVELRERRRLFRIRIFLLTSSKWNVWGWSPEFSFQWFISSLWFTSLFMDTQSIKILHNLQLLVSYYQSYQICISVHLLMHLFHSFPKIICMFTHHRLFYEHINKPTDAWTMKPTNLVQTLRQSWDIQSQSNRARSGGRHAPGTRTVPSSE